MKAISLFSGGGGMDFALENLNVDVLYANDICRFACDTLKKYFPHTDVQNGDVRELTKFPNADLVVGGYPCQSFSLGGLRKPSNDARTYLFKEFARVVAQVKPKYFIAENVSGMAGVENGIWFREQVSLYQELGYVVSHKLLHAQDYGVPQKRKRILVVGVRKDLGLRYEFPPITHVDAKKIKKLSNFLQPFASHGEAIKHLPLWPTGEFYERPHDPTGHMSWYYMSRNRKAPWFDPSFCIVANFRHITLHPGSQTMKLIWSNLKDGFKQKWDFSGEYEHIALDKSLPILDEPRRLSWREAAAIQTFPAQYEPVGDLERKFQQIGNAVPPLLFQRVVEGILSKKSLKENSPGADEMPNQTDLFGIKAAE